MKKALFLLLSFCTFFYSCSEVDKKKDSLKPIDKELKIVSLEAIDMIQKQSEQNNSYFDSLRQLPFKELIIPCKEKFCIGYIPVMTGLELFKLNLDDDEKEEYILLILNPLADQQLMILDFDENCKVKKTFMDLFARYGEIEITFEKYISQKFYTIRKDALTGGGLGCANYHLTLYDYREGVISEIFRRQKKEYYWSSDEEDIKLKDGQAYEELSTFTFTDVNGDGVSEVKEYTTEKIVIDKPLFDTKNRKVIELMSEKNYLHKWNADSMKYIIKNE